MSIEVVKRIWPQWTLTEQIGKGSYGTVYKAVRADSVVKATAAIKVIAVPQDISEHRILRSEGLTEEETKTYFRGIVNDFIEEIVLMESFKGIQNIVSIEDYQVAENPETNGWLILVRMELLTPFTDYLMDHSMSEQDVIRLGIDICSALDMCSLQNIIHRDIKPENIFVNKFGFFKLGDFGIAKRFESMNASHSQKGTYNYMAPEVASGTHYDARVDIYSLGMVLYRLLNQNCLPFITPDNKLSASARREALERRLSGETVPAPSDASKAMAEVVLRACAYRPEDRFATAAEFKKALEEVRAGIYAAPFKENAEPSPAKPVEPALVSSEPAEEKPTAPVTIPESAFDEERTTALRDRKPQLESVFEEERTTALRDRKPKLEKEAKKKEEPHKTEKKEPPKTEKKESLKTEIKEAPKSEKEESPRHEKKEASPLDIDSTVSIRSIEKKDPDATISVHDRKSLENRKKAEKPAAEVPPDGKKTEKKKFPLWIILAGAAVIAAIVLILVLPKGDRGDSQDSSDKTPISAAVSGISIASAPNLVEYTVGDKLNTEGLVVRVTYSDGTTEEINSGFSFVPDTLTSVGDQVVTVSYADVTASFSVKVKERAVSSISIESGPEKAQYFVGDVLNTEGLSLKAYYSNGDEEVVDTGFTCSLDVLTEAGTQSVTVTYGEATASFDVQVNELLVTGIEVETPPEKKTYAIGESLDTAGLVLLARYNNDAEERITEGFTVDQDVLSAAGTNEVTVTYQEASTSFSVEVIRLTVPVNVGGKIVFGPYEWYVVDQRENKYLLVTTAAIAQRGFHDVEARVSWNDCSLRSWLNSAVLGQFTAAEQERIPRGSEVNGGPNDRVFLLTYDEAMAYFGNDGKRICTFNGAPCWWWLRPTGNASFVAPCITNVGGGGQLGYHIKDVGIRPALWVIAGP